jgi:hypothetical protein
MKRRRHTRLKRIVADTELQIEALKELGRDLVSPARRRRAVARGSLRVPVRRRKRQRLGTSTTPAGRLAAEHPDHVWALRTSSTRPSTGGSPSCSQPQLS